MMIELNPVLRCFAERAPLPVMVRAILERCLNAEQVNGWFERVAEAQYTRRLLFSSVFELMTPTRRARIGGRRAGLGVLSGHRTG